MKKILLFIAIMMVLIDVNALNFQEDKIKVSLISCIDGDTAKFKYQDETLKVRFLAIDAPELQHENQLEEPYAVEAKNYTCDELKNAKSIYLEFDPNSDKQDKYERYLAWVFVNNDLLQAKIVEKGYAKVAYLYGDYKYTNILKTKQKLAKRKNKGIWQDEKQPDYILLLIPIIIFISLLIISLLIKKK
jgi:micrococcal nuclease